jgi:hypothetical protein
VVLCAFVSPYALDRDAVRAMFPAHRCVEVHVTASSASLQSRDPKGLYARDLATGTVGLSGLNSPYEAPVDPALRLDTDQCTADDAVQQVLALIRSRIVSSSSTSAPASCCSRSASAVDVGRCTGCRPVPPDGAGSHEVVGIGEPIEHCPADRLVHVDAGAGMTPVLKAA